MKIIEKNRGGKEHLKFVKKDFEKFLGRDPSLLEIRLFPYLVYSLMDQTLEREKLTSEERELLENYEKQGFIKTRGADIGCTKEFWDFITDIVYKTYVQEVSNDE